MVNKQILLVEDESIEAMDIKRTLESFGYQVPYVASSGEEIVEKALEIMPDLILMDIILKGDIDGIETVTKIKNLNIPIIYLTAHSEDSKIERAKLTEPYGYIIKPYGRAELKYAIELAIYKNQLEKELKVSEDKYRSIVENVLDSYFRGDTKGRIIMASPSAAKMYKFNSPEEMIGIPVTSLYKSPKDRDNVLKELTKHGIVKNKEIEGLKKDGTSFWISMNAQYHFDKQGIIQGTEAFVRDITGVKIAQERVDKLYRLYVTLSQINQAIVRIKNNDELFRIICEICVDYGKFQMAWIGLIDPKTSNIKPVTYSGHEDGYLEKISMNIKESPSLHKPSIMAIDEGEFVVSEDIEKDLNRKWREEALKRNYHSFVSIPLKLNEEVIGILNIYSSKPNFFTEEEIDLVKEIGLDISFALDSIKTGKKRELAEKALLESEERYSLTVEAVNEGIWDWNVPTGEAYFSPIYYKMLGYDKDEFPATYESFRSLMHPDEIEKVEKELQYHIDKNEGYAIELRLKTKDKNWCWILSRGKVVETDEEGNPIRMVGTHTDITKRKQAEEERDRFFNLSLDMMGIAGFDGYFKQLNPAWEETLGWTNMELMSKPYIEFVHPDDQESTGKTAQKLIDRQNVLEFVNRYQCKDGSYKWLSWKAYPINPEKLIYTAARDITEQQKAENDIKKSLGEKEVLLREIHHRVKNNLQIIASLLNLQEASIDEEEVDILKESKGRVKTMAMIHEKLYQSPTFNDINFKQFTEKLVNDILYTYGIPTGTIKTNLNIEDINLNIDTAIPLGLIINELVTNIIKYAFPKSEGTISLQLISLNEKMELTISDDGTGMPEDFDIENLETLGLQLVKNLVNQLDGELKLNMDTGTEFKIKFKELKYKERL